MTPTITVKPPSADTRTTAGKVPINSNSPAGAPTANGAGMGTIVLPPPLAMAEGNARRLPPHKGATTASGMVEEQMFCSLVTLVLQGFDRWFDPDLPDRIVSAPGAWMGRRDQVTNAETGHAGQRLAHSIRENPLLGPVEHRRTRRIDYQAFCAQDLEILLPKPIYERFLDMGAVPIAHLVDRIKTLIQGEFGARFIAPERGANVSVARAELPIDRLVVKHGWAVFVPNERDQQVCDLNIAIQTANGTLRPKGPFSVTFFEPTLGQRSCRSVQRPAALYRGQTSVIIGTDPTQASLVLPRELDLPDGLQLLISLSPDRARGDGVILQREGRIDLRPDGGRLCRYQQVLPSSVPGGNLAIEVVLSPVVKASAPVAPTTSPLVPAAPARAGDPLPPDPRRGFWGWLRRSRTETKGEVPKQEPSLNRPQPAAEARSEFRTIVLLPGEDGGFAPTRSNVPLASCRLSVVGLALPRLPRTVGGPRTWTLAVTPAGEITARPAQITETGSLGLGLLGGRAGDPRLYAVLSGAPDWETVAVGREIRFQDRGRPLTLIEANGSLAQHYHALLLLPEPRHFPLVANRDQLLGRHSDESPRPGEDFPKIQFGLLTLPGSIEGVKDGTLEQINLSRDHLKLRVTGENLTVTMHAGKAPIWLLDAGLKIVAERQPGDTDPITVHPDMHLVVGCYLVRLTAA